jgi:hypothetical protein
LVAAGSAARLWLLAQLVLALAARAVVSTSPPVAALGGSQLEPAYSLGLVALEKG